MLGSMRRVSTRRRKRWAPARDEATLDDATDDDATLDESADPSSSDPARLPA